MYVRVAIARPVPQPYTYSVPAHLGDVAVGHVVLVPFGFRGSETGYVVEADVQPDFDPSKIKAVTRMLDREPAFTVEQLAFFQWVANYYLTPLGPVIQTALPSKIRARTLNVLEPTDAGAEALAIHAVDDVPAQVLREVISRPGLTKKSLVRRLRSELETRDTERAIDSLLKPAFIESVERALTEGKGKVATVQLAVPPEEARSAVPKNARRMRAAVEALIQADGPLDIPALVGAEGSAIRPALKRLEDKGVVVRSEREDRDALADAPAHGAAVAPALNPEQTAALKALTADDAEGAYLLWGVTGSGKTEVFLGAARHTLDQDRQVLVLVPEIGLTPQLVGRFRARFGDAVAVLHSGLTGGERLAQWRRIRAGEASVAVGARSALFAPFRDLGLVVVDEEHDDSYKQDDGVPYSSRDLAVVLGRTQSCPVILASATPSLESWHNAESGRYTLLHLPNRATPAAVPTIELVDLSDTPPVDGVRPLMAPEVIDALTRTFAAGGKAIVLYNRRGYATMVQCTSCGGTYECPNCGVAMTLHRQAGVVTCHYCSFKRSYTVNCPACGKPDLDELGKGTERVEETLNAYFPDIPIGRMDADTTQVRGAHARILDAFRDGRTRLLIGTQIVAKGHDFPDVHTAVVVSADQGFRMPDFRAAERTYALLVQLAGRAGRGDVAGRVLVQTYKPDHYVLEHLDDLRAFYAKEMQLRKLMRHPPYTRLTVVRIDGVDRKAVQSKAQDLGRALRRLVHNGDGNEILGPSPAALARLVGRWRFQIVLRGRDLRAYRGWLNRCRAPLQKAASKGVRVSWDVDARSLM
ncbi:MAG: primosomal protein N' [Myxococcota bacterium]